MPTNILMPALSPTMTEGNLAKWHKKEGDAVKAGDIIAEIETDKATMEVEAVDEGVLGKIVVSEGAQGVKVNSIIAVLLNEGEDKGALAAVNNNPAPATAAPQISAAPAAATPTKSAPLPLAPSAQHARLFASPLARRLANQNNVDIASVKGTGPHGRVVRADIEAALKNPAAKASASAPKGSISTDAPGLQLGKLEAHTTMRKVIAKRLSESKQQVPHFYLSMDIELDALLALRKQINEREGAKAKLSVNDFIIKACGMALEQVPAANASWTDAGVQYYTRADVSVAVAIPGGLITPIIKNAAAKRLVEITGEMKDLAARARDGKLKPEEFQGGTFSLSNLGMFGVKSFSAIINPPQACILAVGAGEERPVVRNGKLDIANVMTATLSVDHRVVDGAVGAEWLGAFKRLLQQPLELIL
ncbi:MAG: pyruvate dehydrogenase complex dihydrolipoamide acetyltransferase [Thalassospira sp.]|nr:pyruvate dehydrogenase complex dihydrolipoamide acetyltransferase [Thalassospira sp.]